MQKHGLVWAIVRPGVLANWGIRRSL